MVCIIGVSILLRLFRLDYRSYWLDESFSVLHAASLQQIFSQAANESHPPLYYIILHFWMRGFGDSEVATRLLSVLLGVGVVIMMYALGSLLFNRETGIIASLIVALSVFQITHAQEARMYALLAFLSLLSMYFFIKLMHADNNPNKWKWYYLIATTLLLYTHLYGLFILLVQHVYFIISSVLLKEKPQITFKEWLLINLFLGILFLPWIIVLIQQFMNIQRGVFVNILWLTPPLLADLFDTFLMYVHYNIVTLVLFSVLTISALIHHEKQGKSSTKFYSSEVITLCLLWILVPILIPYTLSKVFVPIYSPKYTIAASLGFMMLTARGISQIRNKYLKGIFLLWIILLSSMSLWSYYYTDPVSEPWREVAAYVDENALINDDVIVKPAYATDSFERYTQRQDLRIVTQESEIPLDIKRVWLVVRYNNHNESASDESAFLKENIVTKKTFGDITVYLIDHNNTISKK